MNEIWQAIKDYAVDTWRAFLTGWDQFWFAPKDPTTLAVIRISVGLILLYIHATCVFRVNDFVGQHGWVDAQAINALRNLATDRTKVPEAEQLHHEWWAQSIYFYVQDPTGVYLIYFVFLAAIVAFTLGLFTKWSNLIVWLGHLSYVHRGYLLWFGMDTILLMLLLYLLVGPSGATLSLDRLRVRWRTAREALHAKGRVVAEPALAPSWLANLAIRLIQLHMCIVYFCSGCAKLQGATWWNGYAGWYTMQYKEFEVVPMTWLGHAPDWVWQGVSSGVSLSTILFEVGFAFCVWNRRVRPFVLLFGVALHAGIGLFMGLGGFAMSMITGVGAFVYPESMRKFLSLVLKGPNGYRFFFDRHDPSQVRMATWVRMADPYEQIELVETHASPGTYPGGALVHADGTAQGLPAFIRLFKSFKTLWVIWPGAIWSFLGAGAAEPAAVHAGSRSRS